MISCFQNVCPRGSSWYSLYIQPLLGVSICQMFALDAETLRFKLEALNYKQSAAIYRLTPITMDSLITLKTQIQQGLAKENARKVQPKTRGSATAQIDRSRIPSHMNRNVVKPDPQMKQEHSVEPSKLTTLVNNSNISNVVFVGPPSDSGATKKRACKWSINCDRYLTLYSITDRYMYEKISEKSESVYDIFVPVFL